MTEPALTVADRHFGELWSQLGIDAESAAVRGRLREVVVLASSSRGGSSFLSEMLRGSRQLLHFRAEINPFLKLCGLTYPLGGNESDTLDAREPLDGETLSRLDRFLSWEIGMPAGDREAGLPALGDDESRERFALDLYGRLCLQWPGVAFRPETVRRWVLASLTTLRAERSWRAGEFPDPAFFHTLFLSRVRAAHPEVNPYYYDLPPQLVRRFCPEAPAPAGPPRPELLEEPPFITTLPWARLADRTDDALDRHPLIVKTPSNAYRLDFLKSLFPNARLRVLHLVRNPAASTNGLYDGWRHHGFFSHRMESPLDIRDYSDVFPIWGPRWWNFDLPPRWREWIHRPLVEVCGFQWRSAHRSILDFLAANPDIEHYRFRFEDLIAGPRSRRRAMNGLLDWLGIDATGLRGVIEHGLPPIMATDQPRTGRWRRREELLPPVLEDLGTLRLVEELGYAEDRDGWL